MTKLSVGSPGTDRVVTDYPGVGTRSGFSARIRRVTQAWLSAHHVRWCEIRFDVVAVLMRPGRPVTLEHYEAAF